MPADPAQNDRLIAHAPPAGGPRRNFLAKALAFLTGGALVTLPTAAGLAFFLDPLLRKRGTSGGGAGRRDAEGFLPVTPLAAIPADGRPQIFTVYDDAVDAWNKFANQPVGRVFLRRLPDGSVTAFNMRCPHLGCAVDYRPSQNDYLCPCHMSAFALDGQKKNEIPPRDLDSLEVKVKDKSEVWVRYEVFKAGTPDRIVISA
ncbi:MAG TPA: Rieske 2Fe-2S domain-containing protein [Planctomycetaceae bacterium]|jgi:menaquinol-cytochrome c reductase iron-sulfur subunit|nr:Rieske 2Fe-2S domain-containing protein [Planctomycetaceae bacterium]